MPKKSAGKKKNNQVKSFKKHIIFLCSCCSLVFLLFLASFNFNSFLKTSQVLGVTTENTKGSSLESQKVYWENFLSKNPTYLDGWIELSIIELNLGDKNYALGAFNTARAINPNSQSVKDLEKLLEL